MCEDISLRALPQEERAARYEETKREYAALSRRGLHLDMSRGKPCPEQLQLSQELLDAPLGDPHGEDGMDVRNYGGLEGLPEARRLLGSLLSVPAGAVLMGGNSSLALMYDTVAAALLFGVLPGCRPWRDGGPIAFLCPVPGYDRHFAICDALGIGMIPIPMDDFGPDMDLVESLVKEDPSIKGIWCVPQYSNPGGVTYSDQVVRRLAAMPAAAGDFRIFWDNAYCVHHLYEETPPRLLSLYDACRDGGHPHRPYMFTSTSKITFPNGGICALAASPASLEHFRRLLSARLISHDKINQLRHCRFLRDRAGVEDLMRRHAQVLRPKFELVESILSRELPGSAYGSWSRPQGGYFVSFQAPVGCARRIVSLCREAGLTLTEAGATYPGGQDPRDSNIRLAPTMPPLGELEAALELFTTAVRLAAWEKAWGERTAI